MIHLHQVGLKRRSTSSPRLPSTSSFALQEPKRQRSFTDNPIAADNLLLDPLLKESWDDIIQSLAEVSTNDGIIEKSFGSTIPGAMGFDWMQHQG